jgi:hypothetical protein
LKDVLDLGSILRDLGKFLGLLYRNTEGFSGELFLNIDVFSKFLNFGELRRILTDFFGYKIYKNLFLRAFWGVLIHSNIHPFYNNGFRSEVFLLVFLLIKNTRRNTSPSTPNVDMCGIHGLYGQ